MSKRYSYEIYSFIDDKNRVRWAYDIHDNDDTILWHGEWLPELYEGSSTHWANEATAERNAEARVKELNK